MNMYQATLKDNRDKTMMSILAIQQSLEALENPDSWYGRQHTEILEGYKAVLAIWRNMPDDFEAKP